MHLYHKKRIDACDNEIERHLKMLGATALPKGAYDEILIPSRLK